MVNLQLILLDFDPFSMFFNRGQSENVKRKCKARLIQLKIKLKDAYIGGKKSVEFSRRIICKPCLGTGSANPSANNKCSGCGGKGVKMVMQRMGHMVLQSQQTCPDCKGEGNVIKEKCKTCKGEKIQYVNKKLDVDVDKGVGDGHRYPFPDQGDEYPDIETGDLVIEIFFEKDETFIRKGADLIYKTQITLLQALTGIKLVLTHLDGRKILIQSKNAEVIKPGVFKTVKDLGMPFHNSPYRYGNLYLDFEIVFPGELDADEVKQITAVNF
jgi:DnaJ family protein A protein 2